MIAVGLMTGTALDGNIDLALLHTDGEAVQAFGPWELAPYPDEVRRSLAAAQVAALAWRFEGPEPEAFWAAEQALTRAQSGAVTAFLARHEVAEAEVAAIGFHGQTVLHRAPRPGTPGATRQLGDGALMAALTGIDTVWDFRTADVRAGGQGAPLAAVYHAALLRGVPDAAVLNLGGVGNLTWCGPDGALTAFDTGPANGPLDDWVRRHTGAAMDRDGAIGGRGVVDERRLRRMLDHPYLAAAPPKSLDRFDFAASMVDGLGLEDGAATLTAFTAACVGRGLDLLPVRPGRVIVCGGGRRNPGLMTALGARAGVEAIAAEAVGWRGDAIEAECFAFLAVRTLRGLPISFPGTTGVPAPMVGGRVARRG